MTGPLTFALLLKALWTGMAGAGGAGLRHWVGTHTRRLIGDQFPWGTLFINLSGALAIGIITAVLVHHQALQSWHAPLVLGFLGGFTTFSTLMLESARLRRQGHLGRFALYLLATCILGPLAAFAGLALGKGL